jgi:autotransporter-associated beta strand protein
LRSRIRSRVGFVLAASVAGLLVSLSARAGTMYWDTNGTAGASGAATGTWGVDPFWTTDVNGVALPGAYVPGSDAVFSAGFAGSPGTVTISGTQTAGSITDYQAGLLTLSGGTGLNLGGSSQNVVSLSSSTASLTITTPITQLSGINYLGNSAGGLTLGAVDAGGFGFSFAGYQIVSAPCIVINGLFTGTTPTGAVAANVNGGGYVAMNNTANTWTGDMTLNSGRFSYSGGTATTTSQLGLGSATSYKRITLQSSGTFQVTGADYDVNVPTATNLAAGQVFFISLGGGAFDVTAGRTFTLDEGTSGVSGTGLNANVLQGDSTLTKFGTGTLALQKQTVFSGAIVVSAGTIRSLGPVGTFGSSAAGTTIMSGAAYDVNGQTVTDAESLTIAGAGLAAAPLGAITNSSSAHASFGGTIAMTADSTFGTADAGNLTLAGVLSGAFAVTIANAGTGGVILSGINTYTGSTTVKSGSLALASPSAFGTGTSFMFLGDSAVNLPATLILGGGGTYGKTLSLRSGVTAALTLTSSATDAPVIFNGAIVGTNSLRLNNTTSQSFQIGTGSGFGLIDLTGKVSNVGTGTGTVTLGGQTNINVSEVIQSSATSPLILSGFMLHSLSTVSAGSLTFLMTNSKPSGRPVNVASGATVALGFGGTGQFTATDVGKVLGGTFTINFAATGSFLGFDTSLATGGTATLSTNLTNGQVASLGIAKLGINTLVLTGTSTYTGDTVIQSGALSAAEGTGLPAASALTIAGTLTPATFIPLTAGFARPLGASAGQMRVAGQGSGFSSRLASQQVAFGTVAAPAALTWGDANFNPGTLVLNDATATNALEFLNPLNLGASPRTVAINATAAGTAATLSGRLTGGAGGSLLKTGAGTLLVTNPANTYAGPTTIAAGTLQFAGGGAVAGSMPLPTDNVVNVNGGTLQFLNDSAGVLAYGNDVTVSGSQTIGAGHFAGATTGSTVALGNLSAPAAAPSTTTFTATDGYGLSFTGLQLAGGPGQTTTLVANARVGFNGSVTNRQSGFAPGNDDTLVLDGASTEGVINGVISDATGGSTAAGGATRLTKQGAGNWTLGGANVATGAVTVSAGNLTLANANALGAAAVTVAGGGTLSANGDVAIGGLTPGTLTATQGTVTVAGGTVAGNQGTLSLLDGAINALTIKGSNFATPSGQSLTLGGTGAGAVAVLNLETGSSSVDSISLAGGNNNKLLVQAGGALVNLSAVAGTVLGNGTYTLLTAAGGATYTGSFSLGRVGTPNGQVANLVQTPTALQLVVAGVTPTIANGNAWWNGAKGAAWNAAAGGISNFSTTPAGPDDAGLPDGTTNVFFNANTAANLTHALGQNFTVNSLSFTAAATSSVAITGPSTLALNAASGFTDQATVSYQAGVGLVVQAGSAAHTIGTPVALGANQTWQIDNAAANPLTVSGPIGGAFALTKTGSGGLALTGANTFSGGLTVNGGTVSFLNDGSFGAAGMSIALDGGTLASTAAGQFYLSRLLVIGAGGGTLSLTNSGLRMILSGFSGSQLMGVGPFTKTGPGVLQLLTAPVSFSGAFNVNGAVEADVTGAMGTGPVAVNTGGELAITTGIVLANAFTFNGGTVSPLFGTATLPATATVNAAGDFTFSTRDFLSKSVGRGVTVAAPISGAGNLAGFVVATGSTANRQIVLLSGNNSAWSGNITTAGATAVNGVTVRLGSTTALGTSAGGTTVLAGGTLDLNGVTLAGAEPLSLGGSGSNSLPLALTNEVTTAAAFGGPILLTAATTIGANTTGGDFTLSGSISGNFGLTKGGTSTTQTVILTGANTYLGTTTIAAGLLQIGNGGTTGSLAAGGSVVNNATLAFNRSNALAQGTDFSAAAMTGTGAVLQLGTGVLTLGAANTFSGSLTLTAGTVSVAASANLGGAAANNTIIFNGGTLQITGTAMTSLGAHTPSFTAGKTIRLDINNAANVFTLGQVLNQAGGGLVKTGAGTLILSAVSTFTGGTSVDDGTIVVSGSLTGSAVTVGGSPTYTSDAILRGAGTVGSLQVGVASGNPGATVDPGLAADSAGVLNAGAFSEGLNGHLALQLGGSTAGTRIAGVDYDQLKTSGSVSLAAGADLRLTLLTGYVHPVAGTNFFVVSNGGAAMTGTFTSLNGTVQDLSEGRSLTIDGNPFLISYSGRSATNTFSGAGRDIVLQAIPEPGAAFLLLGGMTACLARRRSRPGCNSK